MPTPSEVIGWVGKLPGPSAVVYESGPTGFGLARALTAAGVRCEVAAASKLQRPAGDRVKTDARDALHLARLLRLDEVVAVRVPSEVEESARDLVRCREAARADLMRARHRLSKLLLRHGIVYSGGKAWTQAHDYWLLRQSFPLAGTQAAFQDAYETVVLAAGRRDRLDAAILEMAADGQFTPVVRRLSCLRGISTLTAFSLAVEIGDWDRFTGAGIGAYLGLVPSEHSSGASRSQGSITKTGNAHVRRLLVEAAWHHRKPYRPTAVLRRRWQLASPAAVARAQAATTGCTSGGSATPTARSGPCWPTSPSPASSPAGAGRWPRSPTNGPQADRGGQHPGPAACGTTRPEAMSSHVPQTVFVPWAR